MPCLTGFAGQRPLLLHQQGGRKSWPAAAPSGGRAGNGVPGTTSERRPGCRCSRRSSVAGAAAACATASARSHTSTRNVPLRPSHWARDPARSPLATPRPRGTSQSLGKRLAGPWKVTARQWGTCDHSVSMYLLSAYCVPGPLWRALGKWGLGG